MQAKELMTQNPIFCEADTLIEDVARLMAEHDIGEIPVVDDQRRPIGVITDRDVCCRVVAKGQNPLETPVRAAMSEPAISVTKEDSIETCCQRMEENQIRRIPVVDEAGVLCGMVAQADIAQLEEGNIIARVMRNLSTPSHQASRQQH